MIASLVLHSSIYKLQIPWDKWIESIYMFAFVGFDKRTSKNEITMRQLQWQWGG